MTAQHYTLNMITVDGWKEHIGDNFTSRQQAEAHGQYLKAGLKQVYQGYEVLPAQQPAQA